MCGLARWDYSLNTHMPDVYQLSMRSVLISLTVSPVYEVSWFIDTIWNRYFNAQGLSRLRLVYKKPWVIRYVRSYKSRLINNAIESRAAHRFNISRWAKPHSWEEPTLLSLNVLYNTTSISVSIQHSPDFCINPTLPYLHWGGFSAHLPRTHVNRYTSFWNWASIASKALAKCALRPPSAYSVHLLIKQPQFQVKPFQFSKNSCLSQSTQDIQY